MVSVDVAMLGLDDYHSAAALGVNDRNRIRIPRVHMATPGTSAAICDSRSTKQ